MRRFARILPFLALAACGQEVDRGNEPAAAEAPVIETSRSAIRLAAEARASRFTQLDDTACGAERIIEETGDWDRDCKGANGYALEWGSGDLREELTIIHGKARTNLEIPTIVAGGAFDALGRTVEWRGPSGSAPDVLVVRVHVADAEGKNDSGRLVLARLGNSPCIVAVVAPAADQSDRARSIADGKLPSCLAAD
ncbi:MAG: hypothetical protein ABIS39_08145 [Sphingomicrobium sp.]